MLCVLAALNPTFWSECQAISIFEQLLRRGLSPTQDTFIALVNAFIDAGRPEETLSPLRLLHKRFGVPHEVSICH